MWITSFSFFLLELCAEVGQPCLVVCIDKWESKDDSFAFQKSRVALGDKFAAEFLEELKQGKRKFASWPPQEGKLIDRNERQMKQ
jgi:hypothetical protein